MADSHSHSHDHSRDHDHSHDDTHGHAPGPAHLWQATSDRSEPPDAWKSSGVRVIPGGQLDTNTPQTPGMNRAAAITAARTGAQKLWAGTVTIVRTITIAYPRHSRTTSHPLLPLTYPKPPLTPSSPAPPSQNRRPPPRPPRVRDLRRPRPRTHALGLVPRVHR